MATIAPTKHQFISEDLRQRIASGRWRAGDALPTQAQLMSQYGAALSTVRQALVQLQQEGLIWSRRGKGTFVADQTARAGGSTREQTTLGLLVVSSAAQDPIIFDRVDTLNDAAAQRQLDLSIRVARYGEESRAGAWVRHQAGVIVWGSASFEALEALVGLGRPVVLIGESRDGRVPASVGHVRWSVAQVVTMACELIFGMGHRRVWLVRGQGTAYYDMLGRHFLEAAEHAGVKARCDQILLANPGDESCLLDRLTAEHNAPTALLIDGDIKTCRIVHQMQAGGWFVPAKISVVALGGAHEQRITVPGLTRVEAPVDLALRRAVEAVTGMTDQSRVVHVDISPRLHVGGTCRPIDAPAHA